MSQTSTKRTASDVPNDERPTKRITTSSPEEGELDDSSPPSPRPFPTIPLPPKPAPAKFETKVKYPFKKKTNGADVPGPSIQRNGTATDRRHLGIYDRSEEDDRRMWDDDHRSARSRNHNDQSRRRAPAPITDHWEPSYSRESDRRPPVWDLPKESYRHARDSYIPSRDRYDGRVYARERDSLSPDRSRSRSTSPSHRGKHRLPSRRSPVISYSPPRRDYGVDRLQDQRLRDEDRECPRYDHHRSAPMETDNYSRIDDRYHHPMRYSPHRETSWDSYDRDYQGRLDRGRDTERDSYCEESYRSVAPHAPGDDQYHLVSPGQALSHYTPPCPPSPLTSSHVHHPHTPPPPPSSPPPVPTPERPKDQTLPPHSAISIAIPLKRPPAPRDVHSPSPLPLPPAHEELVKEKDTVDATTRPPPVEHRRKRTPVHRTRKQELEAYGRVFLGCGQQCDYDATAKLGEGTFGYVSVFDPLVDATAHLAQRSSQGSAASHWAPSCPQTYPYA